MPTDTMSPDNLPTDQQIFDKISELLKPYNVKSKPILRSSGIMSDLEVDSTAVFDLIMELEDFYDISIPMEVITDVKTVGELINAIKELLSQ